MNKKTFNIQLRRLACAVLLLVFTLFLSGCSGKEIIGSLNMDAQYAAIGDVSVNNKELWDELKWTAHEYINTVVEKGILSTYIEKAETVLADPSHEKYTAYCDIIKEYTVQSILSLSEVDGAIGKIASLTETQKKQAIAKYKDKIFLEKNVSLNETKIYDDIMILEEDEDSTVLSYLYKYNIDDLAKYLLAEYKLQLNIDEANEDIDEDDEDDIGYFTKENFAIKFKSDFINQGDTELIFIRFMNSTEAEDTMRAFGIKVYKNVWYYIKSEEDMTYGAYKKYYDDFDISSSANQTKCEKIDTTYGEPAILLLYVSMYNYIYTYRDELPTMGKDFGIKDTMDQRAATKEILEYVEENSSLTVEDIVDNLKETESFDKYMNYTVDELNDLHSSFKSYVYENLIIDEDSEDYNRYSTSSVMYGDYYYLGFKFSQVKNENDAMYDKDDTTNELYDKIAENQELYDQVYKLVFEDNITSVSIDSTLNTLVSDNIKVKIYDKSIEIAYAAANTNYSKNHSKAPSNNVLAKITYTDLDEKKHEFFMTLTNDTELEGLSYSAWDYLELNDGSTTAIDLLSKKIIKNTDAYKEKLSKEDYSDYERSLELMLASFANDSYSSSGYPASIGKYNFLMLYFHTAKIEEIIYDYFHLSNVSQKLLTNYESETLLNFFMDYTSDSYDNYFSMNATQIQVFLDINEDGKPDAYADWSDEIKKASKELLDEITNIVQASTANHVEALKSIIEEYKNSSRFDNGLCTPGASEDYDPTAPECYWAKFRKLGLYVSTTEVAASNGTISELDFNVKARLLDIYRNIPSYILGETFPSQYLDANIDENSIHYDYTTYEGYLETKDGLSLLLATGGDVPASAEFTNEDDSLGIYTDIPVIYNEKPIDAIENVYNDTKKLNLNQIKLYLYEYLVDQETNLSPTSITTALTNFFNPVLTRYQAAETQRVIIIYVCYQLQGVNTIDFASTINQDRFEEIMDINERRTDDYIDYLGDITSTSNNYKDWWKKIAEIVPEIVGEGSNN